ncbi:hypothetical protein SAMN04487895_101750 [Paenibacillus sophorae]|uniref:Major tail protein n=1 Tax=Paenibacillus sophorae TaxID=1333845 RepID=A0A1H8H3R3_9BACL|nr:hypothetical protein [Paenibacillus sophorae]QWU14438.1 hypothetical protein KP014_21255 [Paenibacillus sophorae]SEN50992.1 hypothetical protein SAMN04487895_101750 [Paenibacillus sophorae]
MAVTNRWAIRDVATASFFDQVTKKLRARLDSLKQSGLENSADVVYSNGGSGNPKLVGFSGNKAARFTLQDALFTNELIAMLLGTEVITAATPVTTNDILTVSAGSVNLEHTPSSTGALVSVSKYLPDGTIGEGFDYNSSAPSTGEYGVANKTVTFATGDVVDGEKVIVYYKTMAGSDTKQIKAQTDKFAGSFELVLDVLVRDVLTKKDYAAQITIPSAKIEDNWSMAMAPDGDPAVQDIAMEALAVPGSKDLYTMYIFDEDDFV